MRMFASLVFVSAAVSCPATAQHHDTTLAWEQHKKLAWHPPQKTVVQSWFEKAADNFGNCVIKRAPSEADAFIRAATMSSSVTKSAILQDAVNDCLPGRGYYARDFVIQEQDVAIYRAVLRKNGK